MQKENNCGCVVCQVERSLLNSLSTQTARTHFQALARNHSILNHFDSPADVIVQLHEHERTEAVNHKAWNGILHALVDSIADRTFEEIGQQLLLLVYMPAIHKVYREACQKSRGLCPEDIAQQAALCFLETARSPEMQILNGHLPAALSRRFRQSLFRWAMGELRQSLPLEEIASNIPETHARNFEEGVVLEQLLSHSHPDPRTCDPRQFRFEEAMKGHEAHWHSFDVFGSEGQFKQQGDLRHQPAGAGPGEQRGDELRGRGLG
jgi:hypothetical protein